MDISAGEYVREVEQRFLELEGRGFSLSARDVGRVLAWFGEGVPLRVVLSTLEEADRKRRAELRDTRLTLGLLARSIEAKERRRRARMNPSTRPGDPPPTAPEKRDAWAFLQAVLAEVPGASADDAELARRGREALESARTRGLDPYDAAAEVDLALTRVLMARADREGALEALVAEVEAALSRRTVSAEARAERRAFLLAERLRHHHHVPELAARLLSNR